jgi:hypothetical protein
MIRWRAEGSIAALWIRASPWMKSLDVLGAGLVELGLAPLSITDRIPPAAGKRASGLIEIEGVTAITRDAAHSGKLVASA